MEKIEKRKDAQVARELILALPHELSLEKHKNIVEKLVNFIVDEHHVAAHIAIHKPDEIRDYETHRSQESLKNFHAHITLSLRKMGPNGEFLGNKIRAMNDRNYLKKLKVFSSNTINEFLKAEGFDTIPERDPEKITTEHLGPILTRLERRGIDTYLGNKNRESEKLNNFKKLKTEISQEIEVLEKKHITIETVSYNFYPSSKAKKDIVSEFNRRQLDELYSAIGEGILKAKKWHSPSVLQSIEYKGREIPIIEILLSKDPIDMKIIEKIEEALMPIESPIPKISFLKNIENNNKKFSQNLNISRKKFIRKSLDNTQEAHWHACQAVWEIENSKDEESQIKL